MMLANETSDRGSGESSSCLGGSFRTVSRHGKTLGASPYTLDEIERILYREIYPICIWNLRCIAGEWAGFDIDWLQEAILKRESFCMRIPRFLQMGHWMIREPWQKTKEIFQERRGVLEHPKT